MPKFYVALFSQEERAPHFSQAGNLIKQVFRLESAGKVIFTDLQAGRMSINISRSSRL